MIKKDLPFQESFRIMLVEILSRLPIKSLLRFMCVSKTWKTLISSHYFRKLHREKYASSRPLLLAFYDDRIVPPYNKGPKRTLKEIVSRAPFHESDMYTYLVTFDFEGNFFEKITLPFPSLGFSMTSPPYQSKLLCFVLNEFIYLYTPSTRQFFLLTNPSSFTSPEFQGHYGVELGYIPSKDEYIMVHLVIKSNDKIYCEVLNNISISDDNFKLHYNQWRLSNDHATIGDMIIVGPNVFVGGAFYWGAISPDPNINDGVILSFDAETECFSTFDYPEDLLYIETGLMELNDELYLVLFPLESPVLAMWIFSFDEKTWHSYWKFDFDRLFGFEQGSYLGFRWELFIYNLKYLKNYDEQPRDEQVSPEMGILNKKLPFRTQIAAHANFFTF